MGWADSLSRRVDWAEGVERDNEIIKAVKEMKKAGVKVLRNEE